MSDLRVTLGLGRTKLANCKISTNFVNRVFDGDPLPLVEHFVRDQGLRADDIQRLRSLPDRLDAERDESRKR